MHIVIFHYHLQRGGVTDVISAMRRALLEHAASVDRVTLVCGNDENLAELIAAEHPAPRIDVIREIGYQSRQSLARYASAAPGAQLPSDGSDRDDAGSAGPVGQVDSAIVAQGSEELSRRIVKILLERYGGEDAMWWVHNHHIGKNPAFSRALYDVAAIHPNQKIVLHIHDFPECGRYSNLRFLHTAGINNLYPIAENLSWVVINSRDQKLLNDAGIDTVHYLPNPVEAETKASDREDVDKEAVRERLGRAFGTEFPMFDPSAPLLLYPVRTIRRKNVLEAGLLVALLPERANLVVTLPGVSHVEKKYSEIVEYAYREGLIPGLWGIGRRLDETGISFEELQHGANAIVSSSVQEGFGFQYIAPLLLGIPLIARRLDILGDVEALYRDRPHTLYDELLVPMTGPTMSGPQALLRFRYSERLDRLRNELSPEILERLLKEVDALLSGDTIEFSYLPAEMQLAILRDAAQEPAFLDELRSLNNTLIHRVASTAAATTSPAPRRVADAFGPRRFAAAAEHIIAESTAARAPRHTHRPEGYQIESAMLASFAQLQYQRLLYT